MEDISPILKTAQIVNDALVEGGFRFCLIGGLVTNRWGRPRYTKDADFCVFTAIDRDEEAVDFLLDRFQPRIPDARDFALKRRILLLRDSQGIEIDISLGLLPFEDSMIERSTEHDFGGGVVLLTASAEDLIVTKAVANRGIDYFDIEGVLSRHLPEIDFEYVFGHLNGFCELLESEEPITKLQTLIKTEKEARKRREERKPG